MGLLGRLGKCFAPAVQPPTCLPGERIAVDHQLVTPGSESLRALPPPPQSSSDSCRTKLAKCEAVMSAIPSALLLCHVLEEPAGYDTNSQGSGTHSGEPDASLIHVIYQNQICEDLFGKIAAETEEEVTPSSSREFWCKLLGCHYNPDAEALFREMLDTTNAGYSWSHLVRVPGGQLYGGDAEEVYSILPELGAAPAGIRNTQGLRDNVLASNSGHDGGQYRRVQSLMASMNTSQSRSGSNQKTGSLPSSVEETSSRQPKAHRPVRRSRSDLTPSTGEVLTPLNREVLSMEGHSNYAAPERLDEILPGQQPTSQRSSPSLKAHGPRTNLETASINNRDDTDGGSGQTEPSEEPKKYNTEWDYRLGTILEQDIVRSPPGRTESEPVHSLDAEPTGYQEDKWLEIVVKRVPDAGDGKPGLLIIQDDVTEREQYHATLSNMTEAQLAIMAQSFPRHVIEYLSLSSPDTVPGNVGKLAKSHDQVTILFMDIVGFTSMSKEVEAESVLTFLNQLFTHFDLLCDSHHVQKVETAGDCYIVAGGILEQDMGTGFCSVQDHHDPVTSAAKVFAFAKDMIRVSKVVRMPHNGEPVQIRIGMHTGPCVSGLIGTKLPKFSIFGDTMNTASRMESTSKQGHIHVSEATHRLLLHGGNLDHWEGTGGIEIKGKGLMETFLHLPVYESASVCKDALLRTFNGDMNERMHSGLDPAECRSSAVADMWGCRRQSQMTDNSGGTMSSFVSGSLILSLPPANVSGGSNNMNNMSNSPLEQGHAPLGIGFSQPVLALMQNTVHQSMTNKTSYMLSSSPRGWENGHEIRHCLVRGQRSTGALLSPAQLGNPNRRMSVPQSDSVKPFPLQGSGQPHVASKPRAPSSARRVGTASMARSVKARRASVGATISHHPILHPRPGTGYSKLGGENATQSSYLSGMSNRVYHLPKAPSQSGAAAEGSSSVGKSRQAHGGEPPGGRGAYQGIGTMPPLEETDLKPPTHGPQNYWENRHSSGALPLQPQPDANLVDVDENVDVHLDGQVMSNLSTITAQDVFRGTSTSYASPLSGSTRARPGNRTYSRQGVGSKSIGPSNNWRRPFISGSEVESPSDLAGAGEAGAARRLKRGDGADSLQGHVSCPHSFSSPALTLHLSGQALAPRATMSVETSSGSYSMLERMRKLNREGILKGDNVIEPMSPSGSHGIVAVGKLIKSMTESMKMSNRMCVADLRTSSMGDLNHVEKRTIRKSDGNIGPKSVLATKHSLRRRLLPLMSMPADRERLQASLQAAKQAIASESPEVWPATPNSGKSNSSNYPARMSPDPSVEHLSLLKPSDELLDKLGYCRYWGADLGAEL